MILTPKNWKDFQHYKDRAPAWIKLHRQLLDNYDFFCLPVASRALAPCLWLLASEYEDGKINASLDELAFRLRMTRGEFADALSPLVEKGFFDASEPLAECKQHASLEKEREIEEEKEERSADARRLKVVSTRSYVFEGRLVRLDQPAYDRWRKAYPAIPDLPAALQAADDYYSENPPKDGKWFFPVSRWLQREHEQCTERIRIAHARPDRSF
jgi:hypothetical protein